jgi:branched-chain amino acid transport system permease protein
MRGEKMQHTNLQNVYNSRFFGLLAFGILVFLLPLVTNSNYLLSILIMIGFYSLVCNGLTLLMGYAGQISLGHAAFYGIGAYTSAYVSATQGLTPWIGILIGAFISAVIALIVGIPTFKLKGHYLALATLGFGVIVFTFFKEATSITGGMNGFFGIPAIELFGISINDDFRFYYLIWTVVILGILFSRNVINSRIGRALRSIEGSEAASDAVGINIMKYKLQVFIFSAVFASIAGSLYAHYVTFINPQAFDVLTSIYFLIMIVIGGTASIWGSIIGSGVFVALSELLKAIIPMLFSNAGGEFEIVFFGVLLVITLIYMPNGLTVTAEKWLTKLKPKHQSIVYHISESERFSGGKES